MISNEMLVAATIFDIHQSTRHHVTDAQADAMLEAANKLGTEASAGDRMAVIWASAGPVVDELRHASKACRVA